MKAAVEAVVHIPRCMTVRGSAPNSGSQAAVRVVLARRILVQQRGVCCTASRPRSTVSGTGPDRRVGETHFLMPGPNCCT